MAFVGILGLVLICGVYRVAPAEKAVLLRWGGYVDTLGPGMHWRFLGIDQVHRVNVEAIKSVNYHAEMLTQDENYVDIDVVAFYRVDDPKAYLFSAVSVDETVRQALGSAARQAAGQTPLEKILTVGREHVRAAIAEELAEILARYDVGLLLTDVKLQDAKPPQEVQNAFDDAIKAREDKQRFINQAIAYREQVIPEAKGRAARVLEQAQAYQFSVVQQARSEATLFTALAEADRRYPGIQRMRLRAEVLKEILADNPKWVGTLPSSFIFPQSLSSLVSDKVSE